MAKFKISLLTSVADQHATKFVATTISDYNSKHLTQTNNSAVPNTWTSNTNSNSDISIFESKADACYTYDEKLSIHQNSQKELTFNMYRKLLSNDNWIINPYINHIHIGSVIELVDKYDNVLLFIVTKIKYTFNNTNIIYHYTCQDAFSYQYTRQQSGYTITNDASTDTFIGPKTIDYWANKIVDECNVKYKYIPINIGLYQNIDDTSNNYKQIYPFTIQEREQWTSGKRRILKEPFTSINNLNEDEYQIPFIFSCSGSNANAALIAAGEQLDLMIHVGEYATVDEEQSFYQYIWFEPKQNQDVTGLTYSPNNEISNFSLDFAGNTLTTILNVNTHTVGDELISLIPTVPSFFLNLFTNNNIWNTNHKFYKGFFSSFIKNTNYYYNVNNTTNNNIAIEIVSDDSQLGKLVQFNNETFLCFQIYNQNDETKKLILPKLYNYFKDSWDDDHRTNFICKHNNSTINYDGATSAAYLIIIDNNQTYIIHEDEEIPEHLLGKSVTAYWGMHYNVANPSSVALVVDNEEFYLSFYRNFTDEEKEFAKIADECPWLENRLIDFSYFLDQKIISKSEYDSMINLLSNDLRIVNGQLIYYTNIYNEAIRQKTKYLAELTNTLDSLGAEFTARILNPLQNKGKLDATNLSEFATEYHLVTDTTDQLTPILDYHTILNDYFEKYKNSEQRFLKNMYGFRKYFNDACSFVSSENSCVYKDTLNVDFTISNTNTTYKFIAFKDVSLKKWKDTNFANNALFEKTATGFKSYIPFSKNNMYDLTDNNTFRYAKAIVNEDNFYALNDSHIINYDYNKANNYYMLQSTYESMFLNNQNNDVEIVTINNNNYCKLTIDELKRLILYYNSKQYYSRDKNTYTPLQQIRLPRDIITKNLSWLSLPKLLDYIDYTTAWKTGIDAINWTDTHWDYYKSFFPLSEIYYKGPVISAIESITTDNNNKTYTKYTLERLNKNKQNRVQAQTYNNWKANDADLDPYVYEAYQPISFATNGVMFNNWNELTNNKEITQQTSIASSWNYYSLKYAPNYSWEHLNWISLALPWFAVANAVIATGLSHASAYWEFKWDNVRDAFRSFENELSSSEAHPLNQRQQILDNSNTLADWRKHYAYDSIYANYLTTSSANDESLKLQGIWANAQKNNTTGWLKSYKDHTKSITLDTSNLGSETDIKALKHEQYFNFYKYIVATYSFHMKTFEDTDNNQFDDKLYAKNKYYRILKKNDKINKNDTYIRIPIYINSNAQAKQYDAPNKLNFSIKANNTNNIYQYCLGKSNPNNIVWAQSVNDLFLNNHSTISLPQRFSAVTWYPLIELSEKLNLQSTLLWENNKTSITLAELIGTATGSVTSTLNDNGVLELYDASNNTYVMYIFCHVEEYTKNIWSNSDTTDTTNTTLFDGEQYVNALNKTYDLNSIYSINDDRLVNILNISQVLNNSNLKNILYFSSIDHSSYEPLTEDDIDETTNELKETQFYYDIADNTNVKRVYTAAQIQHCYNETEEAPYPYCSTTFADTIQTLSGSSYEVISLNSTTYDFTLPLYLCKMYYKNDEWHFECKLYQGKENTTISFSHSIKSNLKTSITLHDPDIINLSESEYSATVTLNGEEKESLKNLNNGLFWYRYHAKYEWPILFNAAATIETQLQTYWNQAYTASKYCKYFIPEYWQPSIGKDLNTFVNDILLPVYDANGVVQSVTVDNTLIPDVDIWKPNANADSHIVKNYIWTYKADEVTNLTQFNDTKIEAASIPELVNNPFYIDLMTFLDTGFKNWYVTESGTRVTYYNKNNSGLLWSDMPHHYYEEAPIYDKFSGLYAMGFKLMKDRYVPQIMNAYEDLKYQQKLVWDKIYQNYPFIMLEDNYSYASATTSTELFTMANFIFKGKKQPERNYSLSLIDACSLKGFNGQELKPGQGIRLAANDYYNDNDDIYRALQQYLFITDVSYSLRSDSDMNLTINSIKYQEKLLQSLVKLIR